MELSADVQLQHSDPYLIFRMQDVIRGIWFPNPKERTALFELLETALDNLKNPKPPAPAPSSYAAAAGAVDTGAALSALLSPMTLEGSSSNVLS